MKSSRVNESVQAAKQKYIPQRSCIACRANMGKRELVRLVCSGQTVEMDPKGKQPGRGVYLCPRRGCWEIALKNSRLEYGLRTKLSAENRQLLLEYGRTLP